MRRMIASILGLFLFFALPAPSAECYGEWSFHVVWQVPKLGNPTAEVQLGPNGLFYVPSGNKLAVVDDGGHKLWEAAGPGGGNSGRPVFDTQGSIFVPGNALIQEVKLNGSNGWNFTVYQGNNNSAAQLTYGPGNFLYLPLPTALYAVDTVGHYKWMVLQWDSEDANRADPVTGREILACAGNDKAVFVVMGKTGVGFYLVAVSGEGNILWRYWLGDIKGANLITGADGLLYATVNPTLIDPRHKGMVYVFDSAGDGSPRWSHRVEYNDMTPPTLSEHGLLYFSAGDQLYALNQSDGTEAWHEPLYKVISRPAVDESSQRVYLGTDDNRLLAVNPQGQLDWDLTLDGKVSQQPLVGPGGYLYVLTDAGTLYKIKDQPPASTGGQ